MAHGRCCRAQEITVWYCEATSGFGVREGWAPAPAGVRPVSLSATQVPRAAVLRLFCPCLYWCLVRCPAPHGIE